MERHLIPITGLDDSRYVIITTDQTIVQVQLPGFFYIVDNTLWFTAAVTRHVRDPETKIINVFVTRESISEDDIVELSGRICRPTPKKSCKTCSFWLAITNAIGPCARHSNSSKNEAMIFVDDDTVTTAADFCCSEHQLRGD